MRCKKGNIFWESCWADFCILYQYYVFHCLKYGCLFRGSSFPISLLDCTVPLVKAIIVSAFPVSLFVSLCSVALPGMIDIRLFYLFAAILFGINAAYVGSANAAPFYMITSGDLIRFIWVTPNGHFMILEAL